MGLWITGCAIPLHTEWSKYILAVVVGQASDTLKLATNIFRAKWFLCIASIIVGQVAYQTLIRNTLAEIIRAIGIGYTAHALRSIIAIQAYGCLAGASIIVVEIADLAGPRNTGGRVITAVIVTQTTNTTYASCAKWRIATTPAIICHIAKLTGIVYTLAVGIATISIDHTRHTLVSPVGIDTQWRSTTTTTVVSRVTHPTDLSDTLGRRF